MKNRQKIISYGIYIISGIVFLLVVSIGFFFVIPSTQLRSFQKKLKPEIITVNNDTKSDNSEKLKKDVKALNLKLEKLSPGRVYLVINTTENTFKLVKNGKLIRNGICSTGSFIEMEVNDKKSFRFETPKGVHTVKNKRTNPVWTKPDWAFIEEGLPIPPPGHSSRREENVLGDYALDLGNQYMIHGTLYQRFLGLPVTHGCVRLNDADLELIYNEMQIGSNVFIY